MDIAECGNGLFINKSVDTILQYDYTETANRCRQFVMHY
jgi:hypothetical protein